MGIQERFNTKYRDSATGCWMWTACVNTDGYGRLNVAGKMRLAHRISYKLHVGPIPEGLHVCHTCDTPGCVNPGHLFIGTPLDNHRDKVSKGRSTTGEKHGRSKLTENDITLIRQDTRTTRELGALYNVHYSRISRIKRKETWKHV